MTKMIYIKFNELEKEYKGRGLNENKFAEMIGLSRQAVNNKKHLFKIGYGVKFSIEEAKNIVEKLNKLENVFEDKTLTLGDLFSPTRYTINDINGI